MSKNKHCLPVHTCRYVEASEVFKDLPKAADVFYDSEPDCSWGDNSRSMITPEFIIRIIAEANVEDEEEQKQCKKLVERLENLGKIYVDLEN